MLLEITDGPFHAFVNPLTVENHNIGSISVVFAKVGGNAKFVADLSMSLYEKALVDAVKENKPFIDLTPRASKRSRRNTRPPKSLFARPQKIRPRAKARF